MGISTGNINRNDVGRNLGIEWEMGMRVWEREGNGNLEPIPAYLYFITERYIGIYNGITWFSYDSMALFF